MTFIAFNYLVQQKTAAATCWQSYAIFAGNQKNRYVGKKEEMRIVGANVVLKRGTITKRVVEI